MIQSGRFSFPSSSFSEFWVRKCTSLLNPDFSNKTSNCSSPQSPWVLESPLSAFVRLIASWLIFWFASCNSDICLAKPARPSWSFTYLSCTLSSKLFIFSPKGFNIWSIFFWFCSANFSDFFSKMALAIFSNWACSCFCCSSKRFPSSASLTCSVSISVSLDDTFAFRSPTWVSFSLFSNSALWSLCFSESKSSLET